MKILKRLRKDDNKGSRLIKNIDLDKMLVENGRMYTITMYINRKFSLTKKQLDKVLSYK